jgi:hypothetical protein
MTNNPHLYLLNQLGVGRENARTGRDLATELKRAGLIPHDHQDPARLVRQMVHDLRSQGVPICADSNDGFYLAQNQHELAEYVNRLMSRIREILRPYNKLKRTMLAWQAYTGGQTSAEPENQPFPHIPEPYRSQLLKKLALRPSEPNPPEPQSRQTPQQPTIEDLILAILPRAPIRPHTTLETVANYILLELTKILRNPPFRVYTPISYLAQRGWNKATIAEFIKPHFQQRLTRYTQQTLIGGEQ